MAQVLCAVDGSAASVEAVREAVAYCRERGLELGLVGVVTPDAFGKHPLSGNTLAYRDVEQRLLAAARSAREAGLEPTLAVEAGEPAQVLLAAAARAGAEELFVPRVSGLLRKRSSVDRVAVRGDRTKAALKAAAA